MNGHTKLSDRTVRGLMSGEQLRIMGLIVRIGKVTRSFKGPHLVEITLDLTDKDGCTLATIWTGQAKEGDNLTAFNLDEAFKILVNNS